MPEGAIGWLEGEIGAARERTARARVFRPDAREGQTPCHT
jgi:hypothetical protein